MDGKLPLEATDHPTLSWQAGFNVDSANLAGQRGASRNEVLQTEEVNRTTSVSVSVVQSESELRSLCAGSKGAARRVWTRVDAQLCEAATSPPPRRGQTVQTVHEV